MNNETILLPGGYFDSAGTLQQEVELDCLSGQEEELLSKRSDYSKASNVTTVLSRCLKQIGNITDVSEDLVRRLLVADRQYLLLKLHQITFGDRIEANIFCAWPDCAKKIDIDFLVGDIPIKNSEDKGPIYSMELSKDAGYIDTHGKTQRELKFRLPDGEDQEIISPIVYENEAKALSLLLGRCVLNIGSLNNSEEFATNLSSKARIEIEKKMQAVAPQVDLTMEVKCPECGRGFALPFDIQDFFFGELKTSQDLLYKEVHYLAYHYHWSEKEILSMTRDKRRKYIEVLADEIEKLNNAI